MATFGNGKTVLCINNLLSVFINFTDFCQLMLNPFLLIISAPVKLEKHLHSARSEEGRLYYDGEWYGRGQTICIDKKDECPTR